MPFPDDPYSFQKPPPPPSPPPLRLEGGDALAFARRLWAAIARGVLMGTAIYGALSFGASFVPRDDSDTPTVRSGMGVHRDALTGCEYFSRGFFGGVTPRMNREGKHVCR